jgi:hypothetical protein
MLRVLGSLWAFGPLALSPPTHLETFFGVSRSSSGLVVNPVQHARSSRTVAGDAGHRSGRWAQGRAEPAIGSELWRERRTTRLNTSASQSGLRRG